MHKEIICRLFPCSTLIVKTRSVRSLVLLGFDKDLFFQEKGFIMNLDLQKPEKIIVLSASLSLLVSMLFLKFSGFSVSSIVNFYNHIIKSIIFSANTDTLAALRLLLGPFVFVATSLVFFTLAMSLMAYHGSKSERKYAGSLSGIAGALISIILFPTIAGVFLALAFLICSFYAVRFSNMYAKELKKWVRFRIGSNTVGKVFLIANIIIALGVFSSVLLQQSQYESSFKQEIKESVRSLALSLPGASTAPPEVLNQRIESTASSLTSSKFFSAYIIWLPISAGFTTWIVLEFLRNLIFANLGGLFTYSLSKVSKKPIKHLATN